MQMYLSQDMCAVNDPLGQTHSPASSDHYSHLKIVLFCEILTDGQTTRAKIVITAHHVGSASWINISQGIKFQIVACNHCSTTS